MNGRAIDVAALPDHSFGHKGLIWWGTVGFMVIEGSMFIMVLVAYFVLRPAGDLTEAAARARLADYKRRIESGEAKFEDLARQNSQDASAPNGGDLGWANPGLYVAEFEDVLNSLAPGQSADPVITRFGVHLIQLMERRQATLSAREQRELVRNLVREKKLDEAYATWAQEVRGRAYVEFREPPQ